MVAVDDGRHGEDHAVLVLDHRVHRTVPDYGQVLLQLGVALKKFTTNLIEFKMERVF